MKFSGNNFQKDEPEINLIAFIDVLLVVVIFLMLSTTYSKFNELKVNLPIAKADALAEGPQELVISVGVDGTYMVNKTLVENRNEQALAQAMVEATQGNKETIVIISADALANFQAVATVMAAAKMAALPHLTFATQNSPP